MRRSARLLGAALMLVLLASALPAAAAPVTERVIVRLRPSAGDTRAVAKQLMAEHGGTLGPVYGHVFKGFAARVPTARVAALRNQPRVAAVTPDVAIRAANAEVPLGVRRSGAQAVAGSKIGTGTAVDVDIAILDTGVNAHPDLRIAGGANCAKDTGCSTGGFTDNHGHGTHVAGTAAAKDDGVGVVGTAPGARVWAVKVLSDNGGGLMSWFIAGLDWVVAKGGIEVVNASLGSSYYAPVDAAVERATAAGVVVVTAAGNDAVDAATKSPASAPNAITVSAFGDTDGLPGGLGGAGDDVFAGFSNYGPVVDIAAPGVGIYSTDRNGSYSTKQGTSMAAPHVAGAAAFYIASNGIAPSSSRWQTVLHGLRGEWSAGQASACGFTGGRSTEPVLVMGGCSGGDTVPPSTPVVSALSGDKQVAVSWGAATDASGVTAYRLLRAKGATGAFVTLATVDGDTRGYLDTAVVNKALYRYQVRAFDAAANWSASAVVNAIPLDLIPPPATSITARGTDLRTVIEWTAVTDSSGIKGYEIWRSVAGGPWARRGSVGGTALTYTDKGLVNGTTYRYYVRVVDKAANFSAASNVATAVPVDDMPPSLPTLSLGVGDGQLTVKWRAATDSSGVQSYQLYRAVGTEPFGNPVILGATNLQYVHTGLTNGTVYRYALSATDVKGQTSALSAVKAMAPKDLTGPNPVTLSGAVGAVGASLSWSAATDPSGIGAYRVYRAAGSGSLRRIAALPPATRTLQVTGLLPGTTYRFVVRPVDARGNEGGDSNAVSGPA